jgi:hypothetical protein
LKIEGWEEMAKLIGHVLIGRRLPDRQQVAVVAV